MRIGMSTSCHAADEKWFKDMAEAGIECIELSPGNNEVHDSVDLAEVKRCAEKYGITLWSYHLPFAPFSQLNPAALDETIRQNTVERFKKLIQAGAEAGFGIFVMHASGEPIKDEDRAQSMENAKKTISEILPAIKEAGAVLAVEDLPRSCLGNCSDDILELIGNDPSVRVCFDTNHLLKQSDEDFVKAVGDKIITMHVSDFDFENERHWLPGEGDINWCSVYAAVKDSGYDGPWLYELGLDAPKTIVRRRLTMQDYADNAKQIFEGKIPAPIGQRKPNLGMWGPKDE